MIPFIVGGFVQMVDIDGDSVFLKADTINGVYMSRAKAGSFLGHEQAEPARTVVSAAAGRFEVAESQAEVMALIAEANERPKK